MALLSLLQFRFGAHAQCNGDAFFDSCEVHAWHADSAVNTNEPHFTEAYDFDVTGGRAAHWAREFSLTL